MSEQDDRYREAASTYSSALDRLVRAYEAGPEDRLDLLQEIHIALWRSFAGFNGRCSMRTWVYRIAHNTAVSHILRSRKARSLGLLSLEELEESEWPAASNSGMAPVESQQLLHQLYGMIQRLNPADRQIITLYLEGMDAASIGEITGISSGYAATKIHRIKRILADRFRNGGDHDNRQRREPA